MTLPSSPGEVPCLMDDVKACGLPIPSSGTCVGRGCRLIHVPSPFVRCFAHGDLSAEFDRQCHALGAWGGVGIDVLAAQPEAATAI